MSAQGCHCQLYVAPEVLAGDHGAEPADVYSLGALLLKLLIGGCWSSFGAELITQQLESGNLERWLDPLAFGWPLEDASELCQLALRFPPSQYPA